MKTASILLLISLTFTISLKALETGLTARKNTFTSSPSANYSQEKSSSSINIEPEMTDTAYLSAFCFAVFEQFHYGPEVHRSKNFSNYYPKRFSDPSTHIQFEITPIYSTRPSPEEVLYNNAYDPSRNLNFATYYFKQDSADVLVKKCQDKPQKFLPYDQTANSISYLAYYSENAYLIVHALHRGRQLEPKCVQDFLNSIHFIAPEELDRLLGYDTMQNYSKQEYREIKREQMIRQYGLPLRFSSHKYWNLNLLADSTYFDLTNLQDYTKRFSFSQWHEENNAIITKELSTREKLTIWLNPTPKENPFKLLAKFGNDQISKKRNEIFKEFMSSDTWLKNGIFSPNLNFFPGCRELYAFESQKRVNTYCCPFNADSSAIWLSGYNSKADSTYYCAILPDRDHFKFKVTTFPTSYYYQEYGHKETFKKREMYGYVQYLDTIGHYGISEMPNNSFTKNTLKYRLDDRILLDFIHPDVSPIALNKPKDLNFKVLVFPLEFDSYRSAPLSLTVQIVNQRGNNKDWLLVPVSDSKGYKMEWRDLAVLKDSLLEYPASAYLFTLPLLKRDYDKDSQNEFVSTYVSNGKIISYDIVEESKSGLKRIADLPAWKNYLQLDSVIMHYMEISRQKISYPEEVRLVAADDFEYRGGAMSAGVNDSDILFGQMEGAATKRATFEKANIPYFDLYEEPDSYPYLTTATNDLEELTLQYTSYIESQVKLQTSLNPYDKSNIYVHCLVKPDGRIEIIKDQFYGDSQNYKIARKIITRMNMKPALKNGKPAACEMEFPVFFRQ